ncbi:MAG: PaaI family thioesterase [Selenomonadales bacterium]|nr:PaaI family thioesterase [Selenomonadales bacterium]
MAEDANRWCFACGPDNPISLKLKFREEGDQYCSEFVGQEVHQSYDGIVHGGIISTLLDEIMGGYMYYKGHKAVTAKLEIRYRKPTPIGQHLNIRGWIVGNRGSMYDLASQITLDDGTVTAEGKAKIALIEG